uniref:Uncharacterized protein n=1 Tax=Tolypiocladia glomerulata TaxID=860646 RepID=A0A1Z1MV62_9FLOR|nr:hypothetical protein [Tolypiocladia glomerulata]ARW69655.1 hypothetical protein [Tolypiocladia glomerulata]
MVKYWPTKQSIYLNDSIVDLFIETEKKFFLGKQNISRQYLYLDILNIKKRNELFISIINDLKKLILDLVEINISFQEINITTYKIRNIFIKNLSEKFLFELNYANIHLKQKKRDEEDYKDLMKYLLMYLIFGSSSVDKNVFIFESLYTPYNHVKILLENFIIQTANNITREIIENFHNSPNISKFLQNRSLCNKLYSSNRSIILFLNNIKLQELIYSYTYQIKCFYSEKEQISILSSKGIITRYIHLSKIEDIKKLNQLKTLLVFWLEVKDLTTPKIEKLILQIMKYFLYSLLNLLGNIFLIVIKVVVFYLSK